MLYGAPGVNNYANTAQKKHQQLDERAQPAPAAPHLFPGYVPAVDTSRSRPRPLSELVTTYSRELDNYSDESGTARLNVTTACAG